MKLFRFFLTTALMLFFNVLYCQTTKQEWNSECDTISTKQFDRLIKFNSRKMKKNSKFKTDQMILLIRIYNTLHFSKYFDEQNETKNNFRKLFSERYIDTAIALLECKPLQGNWYSQRYQLYIESGYHMRCDNYFILKE